MVCPFPLARIPATICFLRSLRVTSKAQAINGPISNAAMIFAFIPTPICTAGWRAAAALALGERLGSKLT
jgi:hypothetical protein